MWETIEQYLIYGALGYAVIGWVFIVVCHIRYIKLKRESERQKVWSILQRH